VKRLGINPVHFGILFMTVITMEGITPPVGIAMYATCAIMECPNEEYVKESIPFIGVLLEIVIPAFFPQVFM
jgi:TRAP-type C4-dicarboxylate transport system permease large subunit